MENNVKARLPNWIRVKVNRGKNRRQVTHELRHRGLVTVCEEAKCPNLAECWHQKTATFMIMGANCTRACRFCAIGTAPPSRLNPKEPEEVAESAFNMGLKYVVVTSVARDDLLDEGAHHFAQTIRALKKKLPEMTGIEVLTPDFNGKENLLEIVLNERPTVFNHNLETCERLSPRIRGRAKYRRSLDVLKNAKNFLGKDILTKSGIMVGLGENNQEVFQCIDDLYNAQVDILTIGQYLRPSPKHEPVHRYVFPQQFLNWKKYADEKGFKAVASGAMVRSSYKAGDLVGQQLKNNQV